MQTSCFSLANIKRFLWLVYHADLPWINFVIISSVVKQFDPILDALVKHFWFNQWFSSMRFNWVFVVLFLGIFTFVRFSRFVRSSVFFIKFGELLGPLYRASFENGVPAMCHSFEGRWARDICKEWVLLLVNLALSLWWGQSLHYCSASI